MTKVIKESEKATYELYEDNQGEHHSVVNWKDGSSKTYKTSKGAMREYNKLNKEEVTK